MFCLPGDGMVFAQATKRAHIQLLLFSSSSFFSLLVKKCSFVLRPCLFQLVALTATSTLYSSFKDHKPVLFLLSA